MAALFSTLLGMSLRKLIRRKFFKRNTMYFKIGGAKPLYVHGSSLIMKLSNSKCSIKFRIFLSIFLYGHITAYSSAYALPDKSVTIRSKSPKKSPAPKSKVNKENKLCHFHHHEETK